MSPNCKPTRTFSNGGIAATLMSTVLLMLCCCHGPVLGTPSERALEMDALAELLGIPIHEDVGPKREKMPEFLETVYDCWSSGNNDCMPEGTSDANVVRSFLGHENNSPPRAVQSYNHETELVNSLSITFNTSYKTRQPEIIRYALLRIHRRALSNEEITSLGQKCDFSNIELRLYTTLGTNDKGEQVVVLKQSVGLNLTSEQLSESMWYTLQNFTEMYRTDVDSPFRNKHQLVTLRLSIGDTEACSGISPSLLGFTSVSGTEAELIGFSKNEIQASPFTSKMITSLSAMYKRRKRLAEEGSGGVDKTAVNFDSVNASNVTTSKPLGQIPLEYIMTNRCQIYSHTVSFADLGWDEYVILPKQYEANFCGGSCTWPFDVLDNTTKHSYIQGVANLENPDLIPPPCCVPQELGVLLVSLQQSPEVVVAKRWEDMVAHSCSCR